MEKVKKQFIQNYLSKKQYSSGGLATFIILSLCLILSLFYWDTSQAISSLLPVNQFLINEKHQYWRLFTSTFIHGDLDHLLSNSLMLGFLTFYVTSFYGTFLSLFISFFMGSIINLIVIQFYPAELFLVGASGVVYYLWGFWLMLYLFIQRQLSIQARLIRVIGVFLILLIPTNYVPNTSYSAHYIGFLLGLIVGLIYYLIFKNKILRSERFEYIMIEDNLSPELEQAYLHSLDEPHDE